MNPHHEHEHQGCTGPAADAARIVETIAVIVGAIVIAAIGYVWLMPINSILLPW